ncbi:MAG: hypothetical protein EZS28_027885, partial [Streblomastix strix]
GESTGVALVKFEGKDEPLRAKDSKKNFATEAAIRRASIEEDLNKIDCDEKNTQLFKVVRFLYWPTINQQNNDLKDDKTLLSQVKAIVKLPIRQYQFNKAIQIFLGAMSIWNYGVIIPLEPEITVNDGIIRCDIQFTQPNNTHRIGIVGKITSKMNSILYCPGYDQDSVGFEKTGEIIIHHEWIPGNNPFSEDDIVGMEVNMASNPRTLYFFVNNVQQKHFISGIPEMIRFCGYLNSFNSSFQVKKLCQMTEQMADIARIQDVEHKW